MKAMACIALSLGLVAGSAYAQSADPDPEAVAPEAGASQMAEPLIEDSDGSGDWSITELQTAWPELTAEGFAAIDLDGSGAVTLEELQTAYDNSVVTGPASDMAQ